MRIFVEKLVYKFKLKNTSLIFYTNIQGFVVGSVNKLNYGFSIPIIIWVAVFLTIFLIFLILILFSE